MKRGKRKSYPKRHKHSVGDTVVFVFAGSKRIGRVIERTFEEVGSDPNGHATYVISACNKIYPCVGLDGSKEFGNIISHDTRQGAILRTSDTSKITPAESEERGYKHLPLPKLKEMCRKYKLKVGGNKKELVTRLEQHYKEQHINGTIQTNTKHTENNKRSKRAISGTFFK